MAKRLSSARRAKALNRALVIDRAKANDDSQKLQQGAVKSALVRPAANLKSMSVPRGISLEGNGSAGKVVKGALVRARPTKKRFSVK